MVELVGKLGEVAGCYGEWQVEVERGEGIKRGRGFNLKTGLVG